MDRKEVQDLWINVLESGDYWKQKRYSLGDKNKGFCCLGVLCDLAVKQGVIESYNPNDGTLPWEVMKWAGLRSNVANYIAMTGHVRSLVYHNDVLQEDFFAIAQVIRQCRETLFE